MEANSIRHSSQEATPSLSKLADAILREYKLDMAYAEWQTNQSAAQSARKLTLKKRRDLLRNIAGAQMAAEHARCFNTRNALEQMAIALST